MDDHAYLAPSSAHRWGGKEPCAGSVAMEAAIPDEDTEEKREGTAAHWVAQVYLTTYELPEVGAVAPNGYIIDAEMLDGARMYAEYVWSITGGRAPQHVEQRTLGGAIHEKVWGTPDADEMIENVLHVFDYKYGHRYVEVFENEQLICYAADRLQHLDGLADQLVEVRCHIVQPRSFHRNGPIGVWATKASDLRQHANYLRGCAARSLVPGAPTAASPAACRDCRARTRCDAAQAAGLEAAAVAGSSVPFDLSDAEAGRYLALVKRAKAQLEAMESGLEEQLIKAMLKGAFVPQWMLDTTKPREVWTAKPEDVFALGDLLGKELRAPPQPITVPAARKLGIDESVISEYAHRPKGSVKLVPLDLTQAKKVFAK